MKKEIIKIAIEPATLRALEKIAIATSTSIDQVINYSYILMIGLHTKSNNERIEIVNRLFDIDIGK